MHICFECGEPLVSGDYIQFIGRTTYEISVPGVMFGLSEDMTPFTDSFVHADCVDEWDDDELEREGPDCDIDPYFGEAN